MRERGREGVGGGWERGSEREESRRGEQKKEGESE